MKKEQAVNTGNNRMNLRSIMASERSQMPEFHLYEVACSFIAAQTFLLEKHLEMELLGLSGHEQLKF